MTSHTEKQYLRGWYKVALRREEFKKKMQRCKKIKMTDKLYVLA